MAKKKVHPAWLVVHWAIIVNFAVQIGYGAYMVFVVVAPEGGGPLMDRANAFPFEHASAALGQLPTTPSSQWRARFRRVGAAPEQPALRLFSLLHDLLVQAVE